MLYDHYKIRLTFKVMLIGYLVSMLLPMLPFAFGTQMPWFFGIIFMIFAVILTVIGVYMMWMLMNVLLDIHKKVSDLAGAAPFTPQAND